MIPEKPQIITSPSCYNGDKRAIPESTPLGSNQLSFESGFPVLTSTPLNAGGLPPDRQDFNAALNLLSTFIYYLQSGNQFTWSSQLDYNVGATVIGNDNAIYYCIQANGATSPNTVQNPTSSTDYWVQIITSSGRINASALSVTLGSFAQLNSLTLTDKRLTGILPPNKGGTGRNDGASLSVRYNTNTTINTWKEYHNGASFMFWQNGDWQERGLPGIAGHMLCTDFVSNLKSRLALLANTSRLYGYNFNTGQWDKYLNDSDTIPTSSISGLATVAKTVSYNDLTNKPNIPTNAAPMPTNNTNVVGGYRVFTNPLPAGGTWAYCFFSWDGAGNPTNPSSRWASIVAGGTVLDTGASVGWSGFCWRIQ